PRADSRPWRSAGSAALSQLMSEAGIGDGGGNSGGRRAPVGGYRGGYRGSGYRYGGPDMRAQPGDDMMHAGGSQGFYQQGGGATLPSYSMGDFSRPFNGAALANDAGYQDVARDFSLSDFQADPGYQFRMQQGAEALQNSAAARGNLMGGDTGRALMEYGQNFASNEFQNAFQRYQQNRQFRSGAYQDAFNRNSAERGNAYNVFNRERDFAANERNTRYNQLANLAGLGQTANTSVGNWGSNAANAAGNFGVMGSNAAAAGTMGQTNAWTNAANQIGGAWAQYQAQQRPSANGYTAARPYDPNAGMGY
ncbi:MAG: hypothetical protein ACRCYP_07710, partial [Alphaproteobacteria bacterium]